MLRETGCNTEAVKIESRGKPIRAKVAEDNPANQCRCSVRAGERAG